MTERKPFLIRLREEHERTPITELARENDISEAEVARRLLIPAVTLATRYGLNEISAELRRQANEALGLSSTTLRRKVARAKAKLPMKHPKTKRPKLQFG